MPRQRSFSLHPIHLIPLLALLFGGPTAAIQESGATAGSLPPAAPVAPIAPIAIVLSQPISAADLEPSPGERERRKTSLSAEAYTKWLAGARAKLLAGSIERLLLDAYAKRAHLEPTESELEPILKSFAATHQMMAKSETESRARVRQRNLDEIHQKLAAPDLAPAERERLQKDLVGWESFSTHPNEDAAGNRALAVALVQGWKVQRALYRRYGGRVLVTSFGSTAVDGMKQFLLDEEKRGAFSIPDPAWRQAFWAAAEETGSNLVTGASADRVFATAPWQEEDRHQ